MSRELHDSVGYSLTGALVQVMACQKVLSAGRQDTEQAIARLRGIEDTIRETLQEMRRRVTSLRQGASQADNGSRRWSRLCRAFADSTGIRVETTMPAEIGTVSEELSDAVYRIIQEALTNAYRHGNADLVDVSVAWEQDRARILLRVSDNGTGAESIVQGNGLRGMRERVQQLGGEFAWHSAANKGFNIGVVIPWGGRTACNASGS
jgi:signal transduction histidine kinase